MARDLERLRRSAIVINPQALNSLAKLAKKFLRKPFPLLVKPCLAVVNHWTTTTPDDQPVRITLDTVVPAKSRVEETHKESHATPLYVKPPKDRTMAAVLPELVQELRARGHYLIGLPPGTGKSTICALSAKAAKERVTILDVVAGLPDGALERRFGPATDLLELLDITFVL